MNTYLSSWISLSYFFPGRAFHWHARTSHTSFPDHLVAQASLARYGSDFTRSETAYLLSLCQKYHNVELIRLTENEVA